MAAWDPFADPADVVIGEGMTVAALQRCPFQKKAARSESIDSDTTVDDTDQEWSRQTTTLDDTSSVGETSADDDARSASPRHLAEAEKPYPMALKQGGAAEEQKEAVLQRAIQGPDSSGNAAIMECGACGSPFSSQRAKFCSGCGAERRRCSSSISAMGLQKVKTHQEHKIPRNAPVQDPVYHTEMLLLCGGDLVEPDNADRSKVDMLALVDELLEHYAEAPFQKEMQRLCRVANSRQQKQFLHGRMQLVFPIQEQVLPKHGFPGSTDGVVAMMAALYPFIYDTDMKRRISATEDLLSFPPGSIAIDCDQAVDRLLDEVRNTREVQFPGMGQKCES